MATLHTTNNKQWQTTISLLHNAVACIGCDVIGVSVSSFHRKPSIQIDRNDWRRIFRHRDVKPKRHCKEFDQLAADVSGVEVMCLVPAEEETT